MTTDDRCGTDAGYQAHRKRGEDPCQTCKDGRAAQARARRQRLPVAFGREKAAMRARRRAHAKLAAEYDERFRQLYAVELAKEGLDDIDPWAVVDHQARLASGETT